MIYATAGEQFEAILENANTGLVGTVGVKIIDPPSTTVVARTTTGISESTLLEGVYTVTLTVPTAPAPGTTYLIVWDHVLGNSGTAIEDLQVLAPGASPLPDPDASWTPTLSDVGALIRARTRDDNMDELGTFTARTRPTDEEADHLIAQAVNQVAAQIGSDPTLDAYPDRAVELLDLAKQAAALRAAQLIEQSYFPEQVGDGASPFLQLRALGDQVIAGILIRQRMPLVG